MTFINFLSNSFRLKRTGIGRKEEDNAIYQNRTQIGNGSVPRLEPHLFVSSHRTYKLLFILVEQYKTRGKALKMKSSISPQLVKFSQGFRCRNCSWEWSWLCGGLSPEGESWMRRSWQRIPGPPGKVNSDEANCHDPGQNLETGKFLHPQLPSCKTEAEPGKVNMFFITALFLNAFLLFFLHCSLNLINSGCFYCLSFSC